MKKPGKTKKSCDTVPLSSRKLLHWFLQSMGCLAHCLLPESEVFQSIIIGKLNLMINKPYTYYYQITNTPINTLSNQTYILNPKNNVSWHK